MNQQDQLEAQSTTKTNIVRTKNYYNLAHESSNDDLEDIELNRSAVSQHQTNGLESLSERSDEQDENQAPLEDDGDDHLEPLSQDLGESEYNISDKNDTGHVTKNNVDIEQRLELMRRLLRAEREENQKLSNISQSKQKQIKQLQQDYLRLQRDLVDTLELSRKLAGQKTAQIETLEKTVAEKSRLVENLTNNLDYLSEEQVRKEFSSLLEKQKSLCNIELEQVREQKATCEQQLLRERVQSSELLQQFQAKIDDQIRAREEIESKLSNKIDALKAELQELLSRPQNSIIKSLQEDKSKLETDTNKLQLLLDKSQSQQRDSIKQVEELLLEHEHLKQMNNEQLEKLQDEISSLKQQNQQLSMNIESKQDEAQILDFNLQRTERRVKNLIGVLKTKESSYKDIIDRNEIKHEEQLEKLTAQCKSLEKQLINQNSELDSKQNELVKVQLEHENQLESLRSDRDQRLAKVNKLKSKLERDLQTAEIRLAREIDYRELNCKELEQALKDAEHFREESRRLSIELTKSDAKLFNKERELSSLLNEMAGIKEAAAAMNEQRQGDEQSLTGSNHQQQLEDTKKHTKRLEDIIARLRCENERLSTKLRINEMNLSKVNETIKKEHAKLLLDYDRKLEQIKLERVSYDKNRLRYKRYGYKLKKYCEHLQLVHEHICDPGHCGYLVSSPIKSSTRSSSPYSRLRPTSSLPDDSLFSSDNEDTQTDSGSMHRIYATIKDTKVSSFSPVKLQRHQPNNKFSIKRTGLTASLTPNERRESNKVAAKLSSFSSKKTRPSLFGSRDDISLKKGDKTSSKQRTLKKNLELSLSPEHKYYYINEHLKASSTPMASPRSRRVV